MSEFRTDDLDDILAEINDVIDGIENIPQLLAQVIREQYLAQWKTNARGRGQSTGNLSRSIEANAIGEGVEISMLPYGWYNLYGVMPSARDPLKTPAPSLFGLRSQPVVSLLKGSNYQYGSRQFGLPATNFIPELQNPIAFSNFLDAIFSTVEQRITEE
jgi:hypothetical protein